MKKKLSDLILFPIDKAKFSETSTKNDEGYLKCR